NVFSPMHLPVMIGGFILGPSYGAMIGFITPVLSSVLTGMPPLMPIMPLMALELLGYGFMSGLLFKKTKKIYMSLIISKGFGRLCSMVGAFILSATFAPQISPIPYVVSGIVNGFPGIAIQLIVIPILVKFMVTNKETSQVLEIN
ncbi:MAG: ECF transporter S component, partial [Romboutsia sp.]|nr:ECF transporter S component [Romboutsia sp.]